ncbi:hypothetical protein NW072_05245 [Mycoplasmopsis felis]|uniref:MAG4270 family putative restriction endonuclease n=1 Tax=Mycoplasmopsis felis TaxID=33923 RepID=UPI0021B0853B|nr:hypothetical protein [Mycoplasmopsis felis]UWV79419.1 hypothetical protein NW072_05245 [Mycoplasmopsis felis]
MKLQIEIKTLIHQNLEEKIIIVFHKETLILYAYRIIIDECYIDLKTTKSWFESNNNNFKRREELFRKLNLKQEIRII